MTTQILYDPCFEIGQFKHLAKCARHAQRKNTATGHMRVICIYNLGFLAAAAATATYTNSLIAMFYGSRKCLDECTFWNTMRSVAELCMYIGCRCCLRVNGTGRNVVRHIIVHNYIGCGVGPNVTQPMKVDGNSEKSCSG
jgi:hypothetical protein